MRSFYSSTGLKLYEDFKRSFEVLQNHVIFILGDYSLDQVGERHPSSLYVFLREKYNETKAFKSLAQSLEFKIFLRAGRTLVKFILEYKSIPKKEKKKTQKAAELFLKMRRPPNKLESWLVKNKDKIRFILRTEKYPHKKEGETELYRLGSFKVHNTLGLEEKDLLKTNASIEMAEKFLKKSNIPKAQMVLYGDIFIVGKLQKSRTMAWYYPQEDKVYLRPLLKFGPGEIQNLIHELGHRYWDKIMAPTAKREWISHFHEIGRKRPLLVGFSPENEDLIAKIKAVKVGDIFPMKVGGMIRGGPTFVTEIKKIPGTYGSSNLRFYLKQKKSGKEGMVSLNGITSYLSKHQQKINRIDQYPTPYSSTNAEEYFCEAFSLYAMNKLKNPWKLEFQRILVGV